MLHFATTLTPCASASHLKKQEPDQVSASSSPAQAPDGARCSRDLSSARPSCAPTQTCSAPMGNPLGGGGGGHGDRMGEQPKLLRGSLRNRIFSAALFPEALGLLNTSRSGKALEAAHSCKGTFKSQPLELSAWKENEKDPNKMGYLELMASPEASKHTRSWLPCWGQQALKGADEAKTHQAALTTGDSLLQPPLFQNTFLNITGILKISCISQIQLHRALGGFQTTSLRAYGAVC